MYFSLSHEQRRIVLDTIRQQGTVSLAAHHAGLTPSALRGAISADDLLREEVEDALELFKDALRLTVLERATKGRSDAMLKLAAEAFVPESFKPQPNQAAQKQRPTVLTVRSFESESEAESDAATTATTATTPTTRSGKPTVVAIIDFTDDGGSEANDPESPAKPPQLDYYRGL